MNVGFYRYSLYNRGGDRLIVEYANHLATVGHDVTLYARDVKTMFSISRQVQVKRIPYPGKIGCLLYGATHNLNHDALIVDIIHLPLLLSLSNPVIYYAQADDREYYDSKLVRMIIDLLYNIHFHRGNRIVSMSQHLTDIFRERYKQVQAHTIKTGIDHSIFYPEPDKQLIIEKSMKKSLLFMSRGDAYRKGHDIALKTFESLGKDVIDKLELWICGNSVDGNLFPFAVKNFGVVPDSRLRQILSSADIFFYPSRHEGFGLFPLEAMACGCAVVTTHAIPYAKTTASILSSTIGDIASLARDITRLVTDDAVLKDHKIRSMEEASHYDIARSKKDFELALSEILSSVQLCA